MDFRIPTKIAGFDEMIQGGIPVGSIVLLAGNAGSGKTLFSTHLINSNAQYGKSLYCGFFEKKSHFIANAAKFGFDFKKLRGRKTSHFGIFSNIRRGANNACFCNRGRYC